MSTLMPTYNPLPIAFTHGNGAWLWDEAGKQYLDAMAGIAVCSLGHNHPAVTQALTDQVGKLLHTSNVYQISLQQQLADQLTRLSGMDKAFFCNSGAEASETALKLARLYGHKRNIDNPEIIVMENAFHGRTLATLSASGSRKVQAGFEPLVKGFIRAPFNNVAAIEAIAHNMREHSKEGIVAIMVEPIQGEGGVIPSEPNYLVKLRGICDAHQWLLILDEVQTGLGRTGAFCAYQHTSIKPDILTFAKGLGNGIPIGACLARNDVADLFHPGSHGSTFGGNPFAARAALTVLETIEKENLANNAAERGRQLFEGLTTELGNLPEVKSIRGAGLMMGIELDRPCRAALFHGLTHGLLFNVTADNVIRLLPPLNVNTGEIEQIITRLKASIHDFLTSKQTIAVH